MKGRDKTVETLGVGSAGAFSRRISALTREAPVVGNSSRGSGRRHHPWSHPLSLSLPTPEAGRDSGYSPKVTILFFV